MTEPMRDPLSPGRRADDGALVLRPQRLKTWVTLAIACIALLTLVWNALASQVVRPRALEVVTDSVTRLAGLQDTFGAIQIRQNARLEAMEDRLSRVEDAMSILATDACVRLQQRPYEYRKLKCTDYLGGP